MRQGTFAGRLGRDSELKQLPSGKEVVNFVVAVDKGRGDNKETLWVDCSLFGERAAKLFARRRRVFLVSSPELDLSRTGQFASRSRRLQPLARGWG